MKSARFFAGAAAFGAALSVVATSDAQTPTRPSAAIDARVPLLFAARNQTGATPPLFRASREFETTGRAPLLVRFRRAPTPAEEAKYRELGFERGRTLTSGAIKVRAREEAIRAMDADGVLAWASVDLAPPVIHAPLDVARKEIGVLAGAATFLHKSGTPLTGKGVLVGDLDGNVDIYHPALLKPLPPIAWTDVDGDGLLTPGVDGIDLDGSGTIEPGEVLQLLNGSTTSLFGSKSGLDGTSNPGYDPAWDYLYLDTNGDGHRNSGPAVQGAETMPSLGEPVFVGDDVNGDGTVTQAERLVPLGESKIRALLQGTKAFTRGTNLATYVPASFFDDAGHGTGMTSTILGGQPGSSRFLGVAPEAELVVAATVGAASLTDQVQWLIDQGADVLLTEIGLFGTDPSDGSTELELLLDSAVDKGIVAVSPAGNLGMSKKHASASIPPSSAGAPYDNGITLEQSVGVIHGSITWREGTVSVAGAIATPDGDTIDLGTDTPNGTTTVGRSYSVVHGVTPKGAGYLLFSIGLTSHPLPATGTTFTLTTTGSEPATASLYLTDDVSGWTGGANFVKGDIDGCMNSPAFAAKTLAVSAYALHVGGGWSAYPEAAGQLRQFSGRGPDLWGNPAIAIAAPDNPVAAAPDTYSGNKAQGTTTHWKESGGTSGAGSITAGLAALVKQANPTMSGEALRSAVVAAARTDADVMSGTQAMWGAGKLSLDIPAATGAPPTVSLTVPTDAAPGAMITITANVMDDGDVTKAKARFDFGYDGTWDVDWGPLTATAAMPTSGDPLDVKVEVMDDAGYTARAIARVVATQLTSGTKPKAKATAAEDSGCGCEAPGHAPKNASLLLGALVAAALGRRRRPRRRPMP